MIKITDDRDMFVFVAFFGIVIIAILIAFVHGFDAMIRYLTGGIWSV